MNPHRARPALIALMASVAIAMSAQDHPPVPLHVSVRDVYTRDGYLPGARVEVTNNLTGRKTETVTGEDGRAAIWVMPGSHRIAISAAGYGSLVSSNFCVIGDEPARFDAVLGPERPGPKPAPPQPITLPRPRSVPNAPVMTGDEVREAMAFGRRSTKLAGYQLTARRGFERTDVGHLLTPFLRVATMTQVADAEKKPFQESEIPRALVEKVGWIVATPREYKEVTDDGTTRYRISPVDVVIERDESRTAGKVVPLWGFRLNSPCDAETFELLLGRQFPQPSIVTAFPLDAIQPGARISVTYGTRADSIDRGPGLIIKAATHRVTIREEDLRRWK